MPEAFRKSDIEILLSTMNRTSLGFLEPMFPFAHFSNFNILIINQTVKESDLVSPYPSVRILNAYEEGLSRSRNLAIENAAKKIGVITDDDVVFTEGFEEKVVQGFNRFPDAAVVKFSAISFEGRPFRKYPKKPSGRQNALQRLNTMSIEMALNMAVIKSSGIRFDTNFGLGTALPLGEEPVFINDLHNAGYTVAIDPAVVQSHIELKDSDKIPINRLYFIKGAYFKEIFRHQFFVWIIIQLLFHIKNGVVGPAQIFKVLKHALQGRRYYLNLKR